MSKNSKPILMLLWVCAAITFQGCNLIKYTKYDKQTKGKPAEAVDKSKSAKQTLCDIERTRARADILKRLKVDKFHELALKVSRAVTADEIKDLQRLDLVRSDSGTPETSRARSELINEIYMGAILRAGFSTPDTRAIEGTDLKATIGLAPISVSNDRYAEFLIGHLMKEQGTEGSIPKISIAASADQSRYFVRIYRLSRVEAKPDGTPSPIFTTESLFECAEQQVPRSCDAGETNLNIDEFNTVKGLDPNSSH